MSEGPHLLNQNFNQKMTQNCVCVCVCVCVCARVCARARRIKELCQQFPHGITDQVIQNDMPHLEPQQRAMAINKLLSLVRLMLMMSLHFFSSE